MGERQKNMAARRQTSDGKPTLFSLDSMLMAGVPSRKPPQRQPVQEVQPPWVESQNIILNRLEKMEAFLDTRFSQLEKRMSAVEETVENSQKPVVLNGKYSSFP